MPSIQNLRSETRIWVARIRRAAMHGSGPGFLEFYRDATPI